MTPESSDRFVQFHTDPMGEVDSLSVPFEPNVAPIRFARRPPAEMLERHFLEPLTGSYDWSGVALQITLREDNTLEMERLGTVRRLMPRRGTMFRVKDMSGVTLEFLRDENGNAKELAIYSTGAPNMIAPRREP